MVGLPLAHVSWAIADNADRKPCDAFFQDVFGAETAFEMLMTPEAETMGLDREESLMMIGDTMVIPIAPAGRAEQEQGPWWIRPLDALEQRLGLHQHARSRLPH